MDFLKKDIIEQNCFEIYGNESPYLKIYDDIDMEIKIKVLDYYSKCLILPSGINELFYLVHNLKTTHCSSGYFSLNTGIIYDETLSQNEYFGYLPMNVEYSFKFITFNIYYKGKMKLYIQNCEDYPFCTIEKNITNENVYFQKHLSTYTFSYNKDELESDIFSPLNKKRKMLIVNCIESYCAFSINIYTDRTKTSIFDLPIQYKLIRKGNEDNLLIKYHKEIFYQNSFPFISIEKLSGDIEFNSNITYKNYTYKNIILFSLNSINDIISLKIKAKKNSIYNIRSQFYLFYNSLYNYTLIGFGGNHLLVFHPTKYSHLQLLKNMRSSTQMYNKFISFYPINNCNFKIEQIISESSYDDDLKILPYQHEKSDHIFYQRIYLEELYYNSISGEFIFTPTKDVNDKNECLYYLSSYYLDNNDGLFDTSLILGEGFPQIFVFNQNNSQIEYSYYFIGDNYSEINLTLYLLNTGNYNLSFFINNVQIKDNLILNRSRIIQIEYNDWKDICNNSIQICRLSFIIISENLNQNKFIKMAINFKGEDDKENDKESDNNTVMIIIFSILGFVLIIIIIFIILKFRKKTNLSDEINNAFIEEKELKDKY